MIFVALTLSWCAVLAGCGSSTTPPGPKSIFGFVKPGKYFQFLIWEEGLAVMIVDNLSDTHNSEGYSSTSDPIHRQAGWAESKEGNRYDWEIKTADGQTADIRIDGVDYDIAKGAVFVVGLHGKKAAVKQLDLDLSNLSDVKDCQSFLEANRDVIKTSEGRSEGN